MEDKIKTLNNEEQSIENNIQMPLYQKLQKLNYEIGVLDHQIQTLQQDKTLYQDNKNKIILLIPKKENKIKEKNDIKKLIEKNSQEGDFIMQITHKAEIELGIIMHEQHNIIEKKYHIIRKTHKHLTYNNISKENSYDQKEIEQYPKKMPKTFKDISHDLLEGSRGTIVLSKDGKIEGKKYANSGRVLEMEYEEDYEMDKNY